MKLLLEIGKVDIKLKDDVYSRTPLWWAVVNGHKAVVKLLLEMGKVDIDMKDTSGQTALSLAKENGNKEVIKLLEYYSPK